MHVTSSALPARSVAKGKSRDHGRAARWLVVAIVPLLGACSGHAAVSARQSRGPSGSSGTVTVALDEDFAGFNPETPAGNTLPVQEILNMVLPTVAIVTPSGRQRLNHALVSSATSTIKGSRQTLVYKLNRHATWSDGTPIDADDFIYNWQAQSGNPEYKDVGGKPYDNATAGEYAAISSVKGSDPAHGACAPGSARLANVGLCPNGDTITVKLTSPDTAWRLLFSDILPAHIGRKYGWNTGFDDWHHVLSGSWFRISNYTPNQSVSLTRNPDYWGTPATLAGIDFRIFHSDVAAAAALKAGTVNVITPASATTALVRQTSRLPAITSRTEPGAGFEHLDFNEANPYLAQVAVRRAIADGTNRPQIIKQTVGRVDPGLQPLGNRMFLGTQAAYVNHGAAYDQVHDARAEHLLAGLGYRRRAGYFQPQAGPERHQPLTFTIVSTSGNPVRRRTEHLFQTDMRHIGIRILIHNHSASRFFDSALPTGRYDIAEFAWVTTLHVASNTALYCSAGKSECGDNYLDFADPALDALMFRADREQSATAEDRDFNQADQILWNDMVTLPLYQLPDYFAWSSNLNNLDPSIQENGITWNAEDWSESSSR